MHLQLPYHKLAVTVFHTMLIFSLSGQLQYCNRRPPAEESWISSPPAVRSRSYSSVVSVWKLNGCLSFCGEAGTYPRRSFSELWVEMSWLDQRVSAKWLAYCRAKAGSQIQTGVCVPTPASCCAEASGQADQGRQWPEAWVQAEEHRGRWRVSQAMHTQGNLQVRGHC